MNQDDFSELQVFESRAISGAGTVQSRPFLLKGLQNVGFEVDVGAGITGTVTVRCSNSYNPNTGTGNWVPYTLVSPPPALSGSAATFLIDMNQIPFKYIELALITSSGSGTISAWATAKRAP